MNYISKVAKQTIGPTVDQLRDQIRKLTEEVQKVKKQNKKLKLLYLKAQMDVVNLSKKD